MFLKVELQGSSIPEITTDEISRYHAGDQVCELETSSVVIV